MKTKRKWWLRGRPRRFACSMVKRKPLGKHGCIVRHGIGGKEERYDGASGVYSPDCRSDGRAAA